MFLTSTCNCSWFQKQLVPPDKPQDLNQPFTILSARWPHVLAQMSAEFDRQLSCKDTREIRLLFVVMSTPNRNGALLRDLARNSIYKDLPSNITVRYVVGTKAIKGTILSDLEKEQEKFQDLIMLNDLKDEYTALPMKVQYAIHWANEHAQFDYFIKTDDDVIVLVDNMLNALKELGCPRDLFLGHCYFRKKVAYKNSRWMNPTWYACKTFLPYCAGLGYVIGRQVVDALAKYSKNFKRTRLEDATMGLWLAPYRLTRKNNQEQFILGLTCGNDTIVSHQFMVSSFKKTTEALIKTGSMCIK